jgi:hypothetical protein
MSTRNVLVVALHAVSDEDVREAIERRKKLSDVSVLVVAPATNVGLLRWLTGDEDEARAEAGEVADRAAEAIDAEAQAEVGDHDPLLAVEDALRTFPADEIVLAGPADADTEAALHRFHLPITLLNGVDAEADADHPIAPEVTRGRASKTPIVLLALVLGVVTAAIVVIGLITYLVVWLV